MQSLNPKQNPNASLGYAVMLISAGMVATHEIEAAFTRAIVFLTGGIVVYLIGRVTQ